MKPRIVSTRQDGLLVIRPVGSIGFDDVDFRFSDELVALIRAHVESGATHLLVDFSRVRFVFHSSLALGLEPFLSKSVVGVMRVAAFFGRNGDTEDMTRGAEGDKWLDCFETEAEAMAFLRSDVPMTNGRALDDDLWSSIGPEVGPEKCDREGCDRLRVQYGIFCMPHHYEMLRGTAFLPRTKHEQGHEEDGPPPRS